MFDIFLHSQVTLGRTQIHGIRTWTSSLLILGMEHSIKKLYTSSNYTPLRAPWTKFETYDHKDVGGASFQVKIGGKQTRKTYSFRNVSLENAATFLEGRCDTSKSIAALLPKYLWEKNARTRLVKRWVHLTITSLLLVALSLILFTFLMNVLLVNRCTLLRYFNQCFMQSIEYEWSHAIGIIWS